MREHTITRIGARRDIYINNCFWVTLLPSGCSFWDYTVDFKEEQKKDTSVQITLVWLALYIAMERVQKINTSQQASK